MTNTKSPEQLAYTLAALRYTLAAADYEKAKKTLGPAPDDEDDAAWESYGPACNSLRIATGLDAAAEAKDAAEKALIEWAFAHVLQERERADYAPVIRRADFRSQFVSIALRSVAVR